MSVCQALTGRGGWPLSIFMTPEGKPFFAGTYFPKDSRLGMSGFTELLTQIAGPLGKRPGTGPESRRRNYPMPFNPGPGHGCARFSWNRQTLETGYDQLAKIFDSRWGGLVRPPNFPPPII